MLDSVNLNCSRVSLGKPLTLASLWGMGTRAGVVLKRGICLLPSLCFLLSGERLFL